MAAYGSARAFLAVVAWPPEGSSRVFLAVVDCGRLPRAPRPGPRGRAFRTGTAMSTCVHGYCHEHLRSRHGELANRLRFDELHMDDRAAATEREIYVAGSRRLARRV